MGAIGSNGGLAVDTIETLELSALAAGANSTGAIDVGGCQAVRVRAIFEGGATSTITGVFFSDDDTVPGTFAKCDDIVETVAATTETNLYMHSIDITQLRSAWMRVECTSVGTATILVTKYRTRMVPQDVADDPLDSTNISNVTDACGC